MQNLLLQQNGSWEVFKFESLFFFLMKIASDLWHPAFFCPDNEGDYGYLNVLYKEIH